MISVAHPLFDDDQVSAADRVVALAVVLLADDTGWCWAPLTEVARVSGMHRNNMPRHLKKLIDRGWLETQKKPADRRQSGYRLQVRQVAV